ncbi:hypothetical protein [Amycolatopsis thermoflava]|uniref:hypothetical protein n=1 Tax=Amycolatopsis thermoflava TaxID=84480 RepID=UPI000489D746|nr:hypothetical protein [Amycolatopsis thermoflava]
MNTSAYEIASLAGQQSNVGSEFAGRAEVAKGEHAKLATTDTFGNDKMGLQFKANYDEDDNPNKLLSAMGKLGTQLEEIGQQVKRAALHQNDGELENVKTVNDVQT